MRGRDAPSRAATVLVRIAPTLYRAAFVIVITIGVILFARSLLAGDMKGAAAAGVFLLVGAALAFRRPTWRVRGGAP